MGLDFLGGLYLANDLFAERKGVLRFLLRWALYGGIFGLTYAALLGRILGLCAGVGLGLALALELGSSKVRHSFALWMTHRVLFAMLRAFALAVGFGLTFTIRFGYLFFAAGTIALLATYVIGFSPADVHSSKNPGLTARKFAGAFVRAVFLGAAASLAAVFSHSVVMPLTFVARIGAAVALVGLLVGTLSPVIESATDSVPPRRLAYIGALLIGAGMAMQTVQYWVLVFS